MFRGHGGMDLLGMVVDALAAAMDLLGLVRDLPAPTATLLRRFEHNTDNIGIRMNRQPNGTGLVAVDVDTKNGGTLAALTQNRCWSTATASAITLGGGTHFLLRLPGNQLVRTRIGISKAWT